MIFDGTNQYRHDDKVFMWCWSTGSLISVRKRFSFKRTWEDFYSIHSGRVLAGTTSCWVVDLVTNLIIHFDLIRTIEWFTWNLAENQWLICPYPSCWNVKQSLRPIFPQQRCLNLTVFIFWLSFTKLSIRWNEGYGHWSQRSTNMKAERTLLINPERIFHATMA